MQPAQLAPTAQHITPDPVFLSSPSLCSYLDTNRSAIYKLIRVCGFPKPLKLGAELRSARWLKSEVDQWIAAQIEAQVDRRKPAEAAAA